MTGSPLHSGSASSSQSHGDQQQLHGGQSTGAAGSRAGRKGDPRMHRAVAARLADPNMSLFDALQAGGFQYSHDDDAHAIDSENVTLGQRKNQLSRRLRLARKHHDHDNMTTTSGSSRRASDADRSERGDSSQTYKISNKYPQAHHSFGRDATAQQDRMAGRKRPSTSSILDDEFDDTGLDDATQDEIHESSGQGANNQGPRRIMAKDHPEFHPIIVPVVGANKLGQTPIQPQLQPVNTSTNTQSLSRPHLQGVDMAEMQHMGHSHGAQQLVNVNTSFFPGQGGPSLNYSHGFSGGNIPAVNPEMYNTIQTFMQQQQQQQLQQQLAMAAPQQTAAGVHCSNTNNNVSNIPTPSGVAVTALNNTAHSIGMTLEQLALALRQTPNLAQILSSSSENREQAEQKQQALALKLFENENRALYQRAMLLAGYSMNETVEGSVQHVRFALEAWKKEGKRLQELVAKNENLAMVTAEGEDEPPLEAQLGTENSNLPFSPSYSRVFPEQKRPRGSRGPNSVAMRQIDGEDGDDQHSTFGKPLDNSQCGKALNRNQPQQLHHDHSHDHSGYGNNSDPACGFDEGRHVHRLEGKCGHKAILHYPKNGVAHIDFVVGDKVECYQGVFRSGSPLNMGGTWPSQYKCQDLSCKEQCSEHQVANHEHSDVCNNLNPSRILTLDEVQDGKEWIADYSGDETLQGLFKLGRSTSENESEQGTTDLVNGEAQGI